MSHPVDGGPAQAGSPSVPAGPTAAGAAWRSTVLSAAMMVAAAALAAASGQSLWWTLLAQTAATGVICLGLALLMGQGGLIPFGQAMFSGLGGLAVMHALQGLHAAGPPGLGVAALVLLPLLGALSGALGAAVVGTLCTRQSGLAFAMITLGLGELVYALALMFPAWSGGEGGLRADRVLGPARWGVDFGAPAQIAGLVLVYTLAAVAAAAAFPRSNLGLVLRAVRDQPARAAGLGHDPRRLRWVAFTLAGGLAGLGGGLLALVFESVSAESMSGARSAGLMLFTYVGGTLGLAGPVLGAVMLVFATVWLSVWTQAWSLYVGLLFLVMVMKAPQGLSAAFDMQRWRRPMPLAARLRGLARWVGTCLVLAGVALAVEMTYHLGLSPEAGSPMRWGRLSLDPRSPGPWGWVAGLVLVGAVAWRAWRPGPPAVQVDTGRPGTDASADPPDRASPATGPMPPPPRSAVVFSDGTTTGSVAGPAPALVLDAVHRRFGRTEVLRGASLRVATGERLAIIGPNGAGKTTLFNVMSGGLAPDTGRIALAGVRIDGMSPQAVARAGLGRSHQVNSLFPRLTVAEHLHCALLPGREGQAPSELVDLVRTWLDVLSLAHRAAVPAATLSYAEQRQLEIGLAAAGGAPVLLLDEPTAGMSRSETARCVALIRRLAIGRTLVIVEHDMGVVFDLADRVAVLVDGSFLAVDTPDRIRADVRVQRAYLGVAADA